MSIKLNNPISVTKAEFDSLAFWMSYHGEKVDPRGFADFDLLSECGKKLGSYRLKFDEEEIHILQEFVTMISNKVNDQITKEFKLLNGKTEVPENLPDKKPF